MSDQVQDASASVLELDGKYARGVRIWIGGAIAIARRKSETASQHAHIAWIEHAHHLTFAIQFPGRSTVKIHSNAGKTLRVRVRHESIHNRAIGVVAVPGNLPRESALDKLVQSPIGADQIAAAG